tara:strand:+ start:1944 stop:2123 length:180 start_codon:yes stop_codon:yes gene_type:complete
MKITIQKKDGTVHTTNLEVLARAILRAAQPLPLPDVKVSDFVNSVYDAIEELVSNEKES